MRQPSKRKEGERSKGDNKGERIEGKGSRARRFLAGRIKSGSRFRNLGTGPENGGGDGGSPEQDFGSHFVDGETLEEKRATLLQT